MQISGGIEYLIDYSRERAFYKREYNWNYATKYSYDAARSARVKYMENFPQEPEPVLYPV